MRSFGFVCADWDRVTLVGTSRRGAVREVSVAIANFAVQLVAEIERLAIALPTPAGVLPLIFMRKYEPARHSKDSFSAATSIDPAQEFFTILPRDLLYREMVGVQSGNFFFAAAFR